MIQKLLNQLLVCLTKDTKSTFDLPNQLLICCKRIRLDNSAFIAVHIKRLIHLSLKITIEMDPIIFNQDKICHLWHLIKVCYICLHNSHIKNFGIFWWTSSWFYYLNYILCGYKDYSEIDLVQNKGLRHFVGVYRLTPKIVINGDVGTIQFGAETY